MTITNISFTRFNVIYSGSHDPSEMIVIQYADLVLKKYFLVFFTIHFFRIL